MGNVLQGVRKVLHSVEMKSGRQTSVRGSFCKRMLQLGTFVEAKVYGLPLKMGCWSQWGCLKAVPRGTAFFLFLLSWRGCSARHSEPLRPAAAPVPARPGLAAHIAAPARLGGLRGQGRVSSRAGAAATGWCSKSVEESPVGAYPLLRHGSAFSAGRCDMLMTDLSSPLRSP